MSDNIFWNREDISGASDDIFWNCDDIPAVRHYCTLFCLIMMPPNTIVMIAKANHWMA